MEFILRGNVCNLTKQDVEKAMKGVLPERISKYYVEVSGEQYSPKQVFSKSLKLGKVEFTTMDASNVLRRLGFKLHEK